MKPKFKTLLIFSVLLIAASELQAQTFTPGQKALGGIILEVRRKEVLVVADKPLGEMSWSDGIAACDTLVLNGYDDWHLPTMRDLSLIYYALYAKGIGRYPTGFYWSRRENKGVKVLGWCFDFKDGNEYNSHNKANSHYIVPVRIFKRKAGG